MLSDQEFRWNGQPIRLKGILEYKRENYKQLYQGWIMIDKMKTSLEPFTKRVTGAEDRITELEMSCIHLHSAEEIWEES